MSSSSKLEKLGRIRWNIKNFHHTKNKYVHVTTYFSPNITTRRKRKIYTSAIQNISQEPHECGKLTGVQIFLVQVTIPKWPKDHYLSQKVLLVGTLYILYTIYYILYIIYYIIYYI